MTDIRFDGFWDRFIKAQKRSLSLSYQGFFHFELTEKWATILLELVLKHQKKATASSLYSFTLQKEAVPKVGDFWIVTDFHDFPRCVVQTTAVTILPYHQMTFEICRREGEDDSLESWKRGHKRFFEEEGKEMGYEFSEDMLVVFEEFEVVYQE